MILAKPDLTSLNWRCEECSSKDDVQKILILFDNAADIRDRDDGISPLMAAVGAGRLEVVRHLVKTKTDFGQMF